MSNYPVFLNISFFLLCRHYILWSMSKYICTYIIFTKISVELHIRSNRVFRGFLFTYSPLSCSVFIWNSGNQKLGLYYIIMYSVYGIPTLITYQTHHLYMYILYTRPVRATLLRISSSQISGTPVDFLKTSTTCTCLYL